MTLDRGRRLLVVVLAGLSGSILVGGVTALVGYNEATKIDRSTSTVVVREYIDAEFGGTDDNRTDLFTCREKSRLAPVKGLRDRLAYQDRVRGTKTQVVISSIESFDGGRRVDIELELNQGTSVEVRTRLEYWRFMLEDKGGWRVCSAEQLPDPTPTVTPPTAG